MILINTIISLDQARKTGYAVFQKDSSEWTLIDHGIITSKFEDYEDVSLDISNKVQRLINKYNPELIVLEDVQSQSNLASFKKLSMLLGILIKTCDTNNITYSVVSCNTWRSIIRNNLPYHGKRIQRTEWKKLSKQFTKDTYDLKVSDDVADAICLGSHQITYVLEEEIGGRV